MCTATYLPFKSLGFVLTHSRDEQAARPAALPPQPVRINDQMVAFPRDPQGQGTWIATNGHKTVCLLNGAFVPHQLKAQYKHSRGLVPLHFFDFPSIEEFYTTYDFRDIEPFTLLCAQAERLIELRWDEERLHVSDKNPLLPHIWSSVTLYPPGVIEKREGWFQDWYQHHPTPTVENIRNFHRTGGEGDRRNGILMNRNNELLTLSLTSIAHQETGAEIIYEDFMEETFTKHTLGLEHAID
jgi:hypothetical protein